MNREEVAWAGGLFEGEGSIHLDRHRGPQARVALTMTDEDSVRRFRDAVGFGNVNGPYSTAGKPVYRWAAAGFQYSQALVAMLWPWLGQRRRSKAREVLMGHTKLDAHRPKLAAAGRKK